VQSVDGKAKCLGINTVSKIKYPPVPPIFASYHYVISSLVRPAKFDLWLQFGCKIPTCLHG